MYLDMQDGGWQSDAYCQIVEQARQSKNQENRMRLYLQAEQLLVEEAPILPLIYARVHVLIKPVGEGLPLTCYQTAVLEGSFHHAARLMEFSIRMQKS